MERVRLEFVGSIAILKLNRPKKYNAFDLETLEILCKCLRDLRIDPKVLGIVITGEGRAFCTGGDLMWITSHEGGIQKALYELAGFYHNTILEIKKMPKPVVAALNGIASGGGFSMALACDFRIMERSARLKQGYTSNGLSIDGGGSFTLQRLVGVGRAMEILALDPDISSETALSWGLVNKVVENGQALQEAVEFLKGFKNRSLDSFASSKRLLQEASRLSLEEVLEREREMLSLCGGSENGQEGVRAFLEKRTPIFNRWLDS